MSNRIIHLLFVILALSCVLSGYSQTSLKREWDAEKIKGVRSLPYPYFSGFPFLNETWVSGKIEFLNGEISDSLSLRYSSFKDELLYFNETISAQIVIDKVSLRGFSFTDKDGRIRIFRKLYYDGFIKGDRYFEVLSDGEIDLLGYRKVNLTTTSPYKDYNNVLKNMMYINDYQFYFHSPENGFLSVRPSLSGLLSKFSKDIQKEIRRLLRKNRIKISDEASFVQAWTIVAKEGFNPVL